MKWSKEELAILEKLVKEKRLKEVPTYLPRRTVEGARLRAYQQGFLSPHRTLRDWTEEEDQILLENREKTDRALAHLMNRTERAVGQRRYKIGATVHAPVKIGLKREEWAYIAGFFDGEGWVGLDVRQGVNGWILVPHLCISNTNKEVILFLKDRLRLKSQTNPFRKMSDPRYSTIPRAQYQFAIRGRYRVKSILEGILPFSIVKLESIRLVLNFIDTHEFGTNATLEEIKTLYDFRLRNHAFGDQRREKTTRRLREIIENWNHSQ